MAGAGASAQIAGSETGVMRVFHRDGCYSTGSSGALAQSSPPHRSRSEGLPHACTPHVGQRYLTRFERFPVMG